MTTITVTSSFTIKPSRSPYIYKFMVFNNKSQFFMKCNNNPLCNSSENCNKNCTSKIPVVKKEEDVFDKFERVSREGNKIMQEEYLKEIQKHLKNIRNKKDN